MIQCQKCKAENPSEGTRCQSCGADLLPGISRGRRVAGITLSVLLALVLAIPALAVLGNPRGRTDEGATSIVNCLFAGAALFPVLGLFLSLSKTPVALRYKMRATRHVSVDPEQAFADFTKAVELNPSDIASWKARGFLYDRLDLGTQALQNEISLLSSAMAKRNEKLKGELAQQMVRLYEKLIHGLETTGETREAVRTQLLLLDFIEGNVSSLAQLQTDTIGFGTGVTLSIRRGIKKQVREARQNMARAGLIRAIGNCPLCRQWVVAGPDLQCPNGETHKELVDLRFVMPGEVDQVMESLRGKR